MLWLCHNLNSLHVFCRLMDLGFDKKTALRIARYWERMVHPGIYAAARTVMFI